MSSSNQGEELVLVDLSELTKNKDIDSVSGRKEGNLFAENLSVLSKMKANAKIKLVVDPDKVKTVNDSFWKGFFSAIMDHYKSTSEVEKRVEIEGNDFIKKNVHENLLILEAIFNV
jgi:hypothetical protein